MKNCRYILILLKFLHELDMGIKFYQFYFSVKTEKKLSLSSELPKAGAFANLNSDILPSGSTSKDGEDLPFRNLLQHSDATESSSSGAAKYSDTDSSDAQMENVETTNNNKSGIGKSEKSAQDDFVMVELVRFKGYT